MSVGYLAKCGRKKRHATQRAAEDHRWAMINRGRWRPETSNTYLCSQCGGFHAGRMGGTPRGKGRRRKTTPVYHVQ